MMRANLATALVLALLLLYPGRAAAESPGRLVSKGNKSYRAQDYDKATEYYEKASVEAPESPIIYFNIGAVLYRTEEYQRARERFEEAALASRDLSLEGKAWYNIGNCAFKQGERQLDDDLEKALEFYEESVRFYMTALEKDPGLEDAAHNLEVARLVIKDLLDRIKEQQEMMKEQQERMKEVVDSLLALIEREEKAIGSSGDLAADQMRKPEGWKKRLGKVTEDQDGIRGGTEAVQQKLGELFPAETPEPVAAAQSHLDTSLVDQADALASLSAENPNQAVPGQERALAQMKKALEKLTEGGDQPQQDQQGEQNQQPDQQQPQQQQEQQAQQDQKPKDETAQAILDEEKENKKKRQRASGGYRAVDKDW